jgi:predicted Zn-dependent protease
MPVRRPHLFPDPMGIPFLRPLAFIAALLCAGHAAAQELPQQLADRFSEGVQALRESRLEAAEAAFRGVLEGGGARPFVHHNLGIVLQQRGRHADAVTEFRSALALDPTMGPARLLAGTSLLALGRDTEAVSELEKAVDLLPAEPAARVQLADAYERTGDLAGTVDQYRHLALSAPQDGEYAYRLSRAYLRLAQWSFERITVIAPRSARLPQALGREYLQQGRPDLAAAAFEEAARRDPALPGLQLALARIHLDGGRLLEASRAIEREVVLAPDDREARELKAAIDAALARR